MTGKEEAAFWELISKRIAGEITEEENEVLIRQLENYQDVRDTLETLGHYWHSIKENAEHKVRESALEKHLVRMQALKLIKSDEEASATQVFTPFRIRMRRMVAAAAIILFVLVAVIVYRGNKDTIVAAAALPLVETITASKGSKNHFVLPDGSEVWLNAGTTINYLSTFSTDTAREVFLTGEAFFKIRHDEKHPFWIHTSQVDIRDIGTAFNVRAYPSDTVTEATLIEGSIEVKIKNGKQVTTLSRPHEKITVSSRLKNDSVPVNPGINKQVAESQLTQSLNVSTAMSSMMEDSLLTETAWMEGIMIFRNETFDQLAVRMERWYNVTISFEKTEYKKFRFSGTFHNETIEQALRELQLIKSFTFVLDDGNIIIR